jgi:methylenetetrahydrofolate--tRNA-(uracil-5-)-methyltransferase
MLGALCHYVTHAEPKTFQPMKAAFGLMPPLENAPRGKRDRAKRYAARAMKDMEMFVKEIDLTADDRRLSLRAAEGGEAI